MALKLNKDISLFSHFGGKVYLKSKIIQLLDFNCKTYIEPFLGTGSVILNKEPHYIEIVNDCDGDIVNLFKVLQTEPEEFLRRLDLMPFSEQLFYEQLEKYFNKNFIDAVDKAVCFYYIKNCSVNGKLQVFRYSYVRPDAKYYFNKRLKIDRAIERIKNFTILQKDYKDLLTNISEDKQPHCNIYCDPPYYGTENYYKNAKFTKKDHEILAEILNNMKSKIIVTYYPFDNIEKLYPKSKWIYIEAKSMKRTAFTSKDRPSRTELILMNYEPNAVNKLF